jgi:hypothetical protein
VAAVPVKFRDIGRYRSRLGWPRPFHAASWHILRSARSVRPAQAPSASFADAVALELHGLLDISVGDVLVGAWNRARELQDALEQTREKADQTILVPLVDHTIKSEHRPYIDILQNDVAIARLEFSVHLELDLDGILVRVRSGRIDGILTGRLKAKGR